VPYPEVARWVRAAGPNGGKIAPGRSQARLQVLEFGVGLQEDFAYLCTFSDVSNAEILISHTPQVQNYAAKHRPSTLQISVNHYE